MSLYYKGFIVKNIYRNRKVNKNKYILGWMNCLKKKIHVKVLATQSCPTLCKTMDYSHQSTLSMKILQERLLEWIAIPFSRGSSWPRDRPGSPTLQVDSLPFEPSIQFSSVVQSRPILCNCSLPVHHQLPELTQTHVHQVGDVIQPS